MTDVKQRAFMMGDGTIVKPKGARKFCGTLVEKCIDGTLGRQGEPDFALGFAACLDAISRGTIDFEEHPVNVVRQALADVRNVTSAPNVITDVMRIGDE